MVAERDGGQIMQASGPKAMNSDSMWRRWQGAGLGTIRRFVEPLKFGKATVFLIHRSKGIHPGIRGHDPAFLGLMLRQMRRSGFRFVRVMELVEAIRSGERLTGDLVAFTMDDGFTDQSDILAPVFLEENVPLTIFVVTGFLDGALWPWDSQVSHAFLSASGPAISVPLGRVQLNWDVSTRAKRDYARRECLELCKRLTQPQLLRLIRELRDGLPDEPPVEFSPMAWTRARELERQGIEFGSHTATHRIVATLDSHEVEREVQASMLRLREELTRPVSLLAWPIGRSTDFSDRDETLAAAHGVLATLGVGDDYTRVPDDRGHILLDRFSLPQNGLRAYRYASGVESLREFLPIASREPAHGITRLEPPSSPADRYQRWRRRLRAHRLQTTGIREARRAKEAKHREVDWPQVDRLIFACKGNLCRSPYAEARARQMGLNAASVGVIGIPGKPAESMAVRAALLCGVDISNHRSNSLETLQVSPTDLILCMDPSIEQAVKSAWPLVERNVVLLGHWDPRQPRNTIADPFGGHLALFFGAFEIIDRCIAQVALDLIAARRHPGDAAPDRAIGPHTATVE
jgi:protein-tyrosine-phosphatase/peptidoglycan/xylan/chitin deacetylase (PgdA/CDA1 family)